MATIDESAHMPPPVVADLDLRLSQQQQHVRSLLQAAPEPARADLEEALVATERSRRLVVDPPPFDQAAARRGRGSVVAAPEPTVAVAEAQPPVSTSAGAGGPVKHAPLTSTPPHLICRHRAAA